MKSWTGRAPLCLPLGMEHSHTQQWIHCSKMKTRDKAYFPVTLNWNVDHILQLTYIRNILLVKETQVLLFLWCPDKQISLWTLWKGHYSWPSDAGYNYFGDSGFFLLDYDWWSFNKYSIWSEHLIFDMNTGYMSPVQAHRPAGWTHSMSSCRQAHNHICGALPGTCCT